MKMGMQHECAFEGFHVFLDAIPHDQVSRIFRFRYEQEIRCSGCKKVAVCKDLYQSVHQLFTIRKPPGQEHDEFTKYDLFIWNLQVSVEQIQDHICQICNGWKQVASDPDYESDDDDEEAKKKYIRTNGIKTDTLGLVPEVIILQLNQLYGKQNYYFPFQFRMKKKGGDGFLYYKLVAQIEHSGTRMGGHYWVRCLRQGQVYLINDSQVSETKFQNSKETFLLFYHHYIPTPSDPYDESHEQE